jgi:hypothetical protein
LVFQAKRLKKLAGKLLLGLGGLFVGLLICEVGLRVAGFSFQRFTISDPYRGVALRPNAEGWWREEGTAYVKINSAGLRDREHSREKPPNTFRIAVLGDSFAEAFQVSREETFWALLEQRLQQCPNFAGKHVEVINFGVSGYGTAQELITLRREAWSYSPDLVLLTVTLGNDLRDNSPKLSLDGARPFFVYRGDQLVLDDSLLAARKASFRFRLQELAFGRSITGLLRHLRVVQLVDRARRSLAERRIMRERAKLVFDRPANTEAEPGIDQMVYYEPTDPIWRETWRVTEGTIALMNSEAKNHGSQFLVVTLTSAGQVDPDAARQQALLKSRGLSDLFYAERRVKALGEREGIAVLNLAPRFQEYAQSHKVFLHGFADSLGTGHWNQAGHRLAGEIISEWICHEMERASPKMVWFRINNLAAARRRST